MTSWTASCQELRIVTAADKNYKSTEPSEEFQ